MDNTVYNPLERFRDEFFPHFKREIRNIYDDYVLSSGVDVEANSKLSDKIYSIRKLRKRASTKITIISLLMYLLILMGMAVFFYFLIEILNLPELPSLSYLLQLSKLSEQIEPHELKYLYYYRDYTIQMYIGLLGSVIILLIPIIVLTVYIKKLKVRRTHIDEELEAKTDEAWRQVSPLLSLFERATALNLIQEIVPMLQFDKYFPQERFDELDQCYGPISIEDGANTSVIGLQSGSICGNPFALVKQKIQRMGTKEYSGSKTITWTEWVHDEKGRLVSRQMSETLWATVTKPFPIFDTKTTLLYGNDAAPDLRFTKEPSKVNSHNALFINRRKRQVKRRLKKLSRNMENGSNFTMMSNTDFEVRFETSNRNHETQYRLLFTPLAQKQMLSILKDSSVGYGDDFTFKKQDKLNIIIAEHLKGINLDVNPKQYYSFDNREVKRLFHEVNCEYFRAVYFAFAPLLAIPMYQHIKSRRSIWGDGAYLESARWEWENLANVWGDAHFKHERCVTENILKVTRLSSQYGGQIELQVTSYGFSSRERYDYVPVYGGDGRTHNVRVDWDEYTPIKKNSNITICELSDEEASLRKETTEPSVNGCNLELFYRSILSKKI